LAAFAFLAPSCQSNGGGASGTIAGGKTGSGGGVFSSSAGGATGGRESGATATIAPDGSVGGTGGDLTGGVIGTGGVAVSGGTSGVAFSGGAGGTLPGTGGVSTSEKTGGTTTSGSAGGTLPGSGGAILTGGTASPAGSKATGGTTGSGGIAGGTVAGGSYGSGGAGGKTATGGSKGGTTGSVGSGGSLGWAVRMANSVLARHPNPDTIASSNFSWEVGYAMWTLEKVWRATQDPKYYTYIKKYVDQHVDANGNLLGFSASRLDDFLPGYAILLVFEQTRDPRYSKAATTMRDAFDSYPHNSDGGFWHSTGNPNQMWVDGVFMGEMFRVRYGYSVGGSPTSTWSSHR